MNILIAVDSSASAHAAFVAALSRHWPEDTNFRVLTVVPGDLDDEDEIDKIYDDLWKAHSLTDFVTNEIESQYKDSVITAEIEVGNPSESITRQANEWPADIVIVGSHDYPPIKRFFIGSVSKSVLHKANCSVLIARNLDTRPTDYSPYNRVLLAIDDSPYSKVAVESVLGAYWPRETQFYILNVCNPRYSSFAFEPSPTRLIQTLEYQDRHRRVMEDMLNDVSIRLKEVFGSDCIEYGLAEGQPDTLILETARDWGAHLIVVGSHGRPSLARRFLGSVSQSVAIKADCSVQVVRSNIAQINPTRSRNLESRETQSASGF